MALYKRRLQVELFFKWIKQNLHVKKFLGQTENAVRIQIWVAICTYALLLILKRENKSDVRVSQMLHFFTNVPFEEMPLKRAFDAIPENFADQECAKQLLPGFGWDTSENLLLISDQGSSANTAANSLELSARCFRTVKYDADQRFKSTQNVTKYESSKLFF